MDANNIEDNGLCYEDNVSSDGQIALALRPQEYDRYMAIRKGPHSFAETSWEPDDEQTDGRREPECAAARIANLAESCE